MIRRISHAPVPYEAPWYGFLLHPFVLLSNVVFAAWIFPSLRTARIRWSPPIEELLPLTESPRRPIIYYSWHAYEPLALIAFRDAPEPLKPTGIGHDGIRSRVLQRSTTWLGLRVWVYRRRSSVRPTQQIIDFLRSERCPVGLFTDAGGPYGKVKPSLTEIAQAAEAWLVPIVVDGRGLLRLRKPWQKGLPLPFCSLVGHYGQPFDGVDASVEECERRLRELEERATRGVERD
jgi:lysophospholipid acyltransferase (LPLAT)-like uncharacterized protein